MLEFKYLEEELQNYKQDLIALYDQKMGNSNHTLEIVIDRISDSEFAIKVVGPEEVQFIENGRGPGGFPPVNKIQYWVKEKLHETELPRVNSLAFLIGRKIAIYGTTGNHLIDECVNELKTTYSKKLQDAINNDIAIYENNIEKELIEKLSNIL